MELAVLLPEAIQRTAEQLAMSAQPELVFNLQLAQLESVVSLALPVTSQATVHALPTIRAMQETAARPAMSAQVIPTEPLTVRAANACLLAPTEPSTLLLPNPALLTLLQLAALLALPANLHLAASVTRPVLAVYVE